MIADGAPTAEASFRDAGGALTPPTALGPFGTQVRTAVNARGDAVVASASPGDAGSVAIVVRPARGAASAPILVSEPGQIQLGDVAIGARGHVAVAWTRGPALEARVREPSGALSPVGRPAPAGTAVQSPSVAVDSTGVTDVAAVAPAIVAGSPSAVITARRPAGGAFTGIDVLDAGPEISSVEAVAAGRSGLVTWLRAGSAAAGEPQTRVHAASRRGGGALRRVPVRTARGGQATVSAPLPALAADGSAVIASGFGGAIHVARRPPGRRAFGRPRVISTLRGGRAPFAESGNPVLAVAPGGRALVTWADSDGQYQATSFLPRVADRSGRERRSPPRLRATPPFLDVRTQPATVRSNVSCDRPCRIAISIRVATSSGSVLLRERRVLPRAGRAAVAERITPSLDRRLRRGSLRSARTTISAANRYGALTSRGRFVRLG